MGICQEINGKKEKKQNGKLVFHVSVRARAKINILNIFPQQPLLHRELILIPAVNVTSLLLCNLFF